MNKKNRVIINIIVSLLIIFIITLFIVLNLFIDKEKLKTMHNQNIFDSFILNIRMCIADNENISTIDNNWIIESCKDINKYNCADINYENEILTLEKCEVNKQFFSYKNGKIILNQ